jgi:hypothetical protein
MNIAKHRCMQYLSMKKFEINCTIYYIPFDFFEMKIAIKTRTQII